MTLTKPPLRPAGGRSELKELLAEAVGLHKAGNLAAAKSRYRKVLALRPRHPDALHLLGLVCHQEDDHEAARRLIERAIAAAPAGTQAAAAFHNSLAAVLLAMGEPAKAEAAAQRAIALAPDLAEAHLALGNARLRRGAPEAAIAGYRRALELKPGSAEALTNLGSALHHLGRLAEAETTLRQAMALRPDHAGQLANLGLVLRDQGRLDEAAAAYEAALAVAPDHAAARLNRALLLLQRGQWPEGWAEYEWRWRLEGFTTPRRTFPAPAWAGDDPGGRTLFVHAEQGMGSAIQFVRFAPLVAARGARIILECQPPLVRLFRQSLAAEGGSVAAVIGKGEAPPPFEAEAPLMSLPHLCRTTLVTLPAAVPYLRADAKRIAHWRTTLGTDRMLKVGVAWAGNPAHGNDHNRSLPAAVASDLLRRMLAGAELRVVSLQVGAAAAAAAGLAGSGLLDPGAELVDFAETAALIATLDLVISVDTAVAHLAGALARPVWLLLPFVPDWRWLGDRSDSPWYPTMRLFRQPAPGDWQHLAGEVEARLRQGEGRR